MHYTKIQKSHPNMSTTAFCVLSAIADRMINMRQNGCQYSVRELSDLTGVSERIINRALSSLIDEGLIYRYKLGRENWFELPPDLFEVINKPQRTRHGRLPKRQIETAKRVKR